MKMLLVREDLWSFVDLAIVGDVTSQDNAWKRGNSKALATIALGCDKSQFPLFRSSVTARDAWLSINAYHVQKTTLSKVALLKKLLSKKLDPGGDMQKHLLEFESLFEQLESQSVELPDLWRAVIVLASLPESYDTIVVSLEGRSDDELTVNLVKQKLIDEAERQRGLVGAASGGDNEKAMIVKDRIAKCWTCGDTKCRRYRCPKFLKEQSDSGRTRQEEKSRPTANFVDQKSNDVDEEIVFAVYDKTRLGWYIDSGATAHMCHERSFFDNLQSTEKSNVTAANGSKMTEIGKGSGQLYCVDSQNHTRRTEVTDVLYIPEIQTNLLSVSKLLKKGFSVHFEDDKAEVFKNGISVAIADEQDGLFRLRQSNSALLADNLRNEHNDNCIHVWHRRLGHRDFAALFEIQSKGLAEEFKVINCGKNENCECCWEAKLSRTPFPKKSQRFTTEPLQMMHSDICGPITPITVGQKRYVMTLVDDFSSFSRIYLLCHKSDACMKIREFVEEMKTQFGRKPKIIRSDRGGEYTGKALREFYLSEGILAQYTVGYSPQQNGKAERKNRTLIEMTRCLLNDSNTDKQLWGEAIMTANFLQNLLPTSAGEKTPHELWTGRKPNYSRLKVFGSKAWVQIPAVKRSKLDNAAQSLIFVGYGHEEKGWRFYNPETRKVVLSRDARFLERKNGSYEESKPPIQQIEPEYVSLEESLPSLSADQDSRNEMTEQDVGVLDSIVAPDNTAGSQELRRSSRQNKGQMDRYLRENYIVNIATNESTDPQTYGQAMSECDAQMWVDAMNDELNSLSQNDAWTLVNLPKGKNVVGCKWVFKRKFDENGNPDRYRARLVAQGFSQKYGIDYEEVFAPVVRTVTLRTMLAIAGIDKLRVRHIDVKTAFLNGDLHEEIYMKQPLGFVQKGSEHKVCLLKKSIYGLKQAARVWNEKLTNVLFKIGFRQSEEDDCLFLREDGISLLVYVDDMLILGKDTSEMIGIEEEISKHFLITSLGEVTHFLGMKIERDSDGLYHLSQAAYLNRLFVRFSMTDCKSSLIPLDPAYLTTDDDTEKLGDENMYRNLIGALLYVAVMTRPDIAAAVSILSRKTSNPTLRDWTEAKRVLRYLKASAHMTLRLGSKSFNEQSDIMGYVDADWAGDQKDRKSNSGFIFFFRGAPLQWNCRKQDSVTLSSTEAEYVALSEACQDLVSIRRILNEIGFPQIGPSIIKEDNQSCIKLVQSERVGRRSKHIDTKHHYIRDLEKRLIIKLEYCPTDEMTADILTKPLGHVKIQKFRGQLGLISH